MRASLPLLPAATSAILAVAAANPTAARSGLQSLIGINPDTLRLTDAGLRVR